MEQHSPELGVPCPEIGNKLLASMESCGNSKNKLHNFLQKLESHRVGIAEMLWEPLLELLLDPMSFCTRGQQFSMERHRVHSMEPQPDQS